MALTLGHWGIAEAVAGPGGRTSLRPWRGDPGHPGLGLDLMSPEVDSIRVRRPSVRRGWLEGGPGHRTDRRGREPFVEVSWDLALDLLSSEMQRVIASCGNEAIFGGSYGWASAGRFHHAQGQVHRFLNGCGGYVRSRDSYSHGAATVVLPHVLGPLEELFDEHTSWDVMARHTGLFLAFGGVPTKNTQVTAGGVLRHDVRDQLEKMRQGGTRFVNISPQRTDFDAFPVEWIPIRPNTDVALMFAMIHALLSEGRHDAAFLGRYCVGADQLLDYVTGATDGQVKDAAWGEAITGVPADRIRRLAREAADARTMLNVAWALQRAQHGEQPYWGVVALASVLGQVGLPGGGFAFGYGTMNSVGSARRRLSGPTFPQGRNAVSVSIPVARLADMLLHPGERYLYDGGEHVFPDIKLVYWAGGNPFHHHQDLNRLAAAWRRPQTIVVQDPFWTASAQSADVVLPATTAVERNDIGYASREAFLMPMRKLRDPIAEARDDFVIFSELSARLGTGSSFTEGLDERGWLRRMYAGCRERAATQGLELPSFDAFWAGDVLDLGNMEKATILLDGFRRDPEGAPLETPSGRIELSSARVASFGLADCPGHPAWLEPTEWLGRCNPGQLHLITNQPKHRLHSQLDHGPHSRAGKVDGRELMSMNTIDAGARGISTGDLVRLFNERGGCLAVAAVTDDVMPGVVSMPTGAWFDPTDTSTSVPLDRRGNPNVLTRDVGTSQLAQGCSAQSCLVEVELWRGDGGFPAYRPPALVPDEGVRPG